VQNLPSGHFERRWTVVISLTVYNSELSFELMKLQATTYASKEGHWQGDGELSMFLNPHTGVVWCYKCIMLSALCCVVQNVLMDTLANCAAVHVIVMMRLKSVTSWQAAVSLAVLLVGPMMIVRQVGVS